MARGFPAPEESKSPLLPTFDCGRLHQPSHTSAIPPNSLPAGPTTTGSRRRNNNGVSLGFPAAPGRWPVGSPPPTPSRRAPLWAETDSSGSASHTTATALSRLQLPLPSSEKQTGHSSPPKMSPQAQRDQVSISLCHSRVTEFFSSTPGPGQ